MRVSSPKESILRISGNIIDSLRPGLVSSNLRIYFGLDIYKFVSLGGTSCRISIYDRPVSIGTRPFRIDLGDDPITSSTIEDSLEKERITNIRQKYRIYQGYLDVTSFIKNDRSTSQISNSQISYDVIATLDSKIISQEDQIFPEDVNVSSRELDVEEIYRVLDAGIDPATLAYKFPVPDPQGSLRKIGRIRTSPKGYSSKAIERESKRFRKYRGFLDGYSKKTSQIPVYKRGTLNTIYQEVYKDVVLMNDAIFNLSSAYIFIEVLDSKGNALDQAGVNQELVNVAEDIRRSRRLENSKTYSRTILPRRSYFMSAFKRTSPSSEFVRRKNTGFSTLIRSTRGQSFIGRVQRRMMPRAAKMSGDLDVIPFFIDRKDDSLRIVIPKTPVGIIAVFLQRRLPNLGTKYLNVGSEVLPTSPGEKVVFQDDNLLDGNYYEYRIQFIDKNSNFRYSSNTIIYHYVSTLLSEKMIGSINKITLLSKRQRGKEVPIVTMEISFEAKNKGFEGIKNELARAGYPETIIQTPDSEPLLYGKSVVYEVLRQNLDTGDIESFGINSGQTFIDDSALLESKKSVTPLNFFNRYRYVARFGLKSASSYSGAQTSIERDPRTNKEYQFNAYKFRSRRDFTNLPSNREMSLVKVGKISASIDIIATGVEAAATKESSINSISLSNVSIRETYVRSNLISWKVSGDYGTIDHYQVFAEADGVKSFLGCSHSFVDGDTVYYEDFDLYGRVGKVEYTIVPILTDFKQSNSKVSISITRDSNAPRFLSVIDAI